MNTIKQLVFFAYCLIAWLPLLLNVQVSDTTGDPEDHIISSTSVIQHADYEGHLKKFYGLNFGNVDSNKVVLFYQPFDTTGIEKIRLRKKPSAVVVDYKPLAETQSGQGFQWQSMQ